MTGPFDPRSALSPHFRLSEFTNSQIAAKHQLYNIPRDDFEIANLKALATQVLEPARRLIGVPLIITSGFRCGTLNRLIGGASQSQHMLGEAADFIPRGLAVEAAALLLTAHEDVQFDQLIYEVRLTEKTPPVRWIHISHKRLGGNRCEVLSILHGGAAKKVRPGIVSLGDFETAPNTKKAETKISETTPGARSPCQNRAGHHAA